MKTNRNINDNYQEVVNRNEKFISTKSLNYLYPNGHRMTHQMKWFKGTLDRGLRLDVAA